MYKHKSAPDYMAQESIDNSNPSNTISSPVKKKENLADRTPDNVPFKMLEIYPEKSNVSAKRYNKNQSCK